MKKSTLQVFQSGEATMFQVFQRMEKPNIGCWEETVFGKAINRLQIPCWPIYAFNTKHHSFALKTVNKIE
jgi:hypothetical protein